SRPPKPPTPDLRGSRRASPKQPSANLRVGRPNPPGPYAASGSRRRPAAPTGLPNDAGQVWRAYNIRPYTVRVTSTNRPEQAIIDWILRETGYETWHSEPFGFLIADRRSLRVYHTPEMHTIVNDAVDRFVNSEAESQAFGLRVVTVSHPNWRAKTVSILK